MRINAGYIIIYSSQVRPDTEIVLGYDNQSNEYVTWICCDRKHYFWGHYFPNNEADALEDLANRIREEMNCG